MMIEPLGSVTAVQAETYKPQVQKVETKQTSDVMDGAKLAENEPKVDATTKAVESVTDKQNEGLQQELNQQNNSDNIRKAIDDVNKRVISATDSELQFGIHEGTNRVTIKVIDKQTKKVIRELPPEKTLDMIAKAWELAGIMVDEKR